ncbi:MAG: hypothetical protein GKR93_01035 [Gammaproteobacteria bacterium]|nr:hypothetical protein [Gammaproteobacteria bacterium]
MELDKTDTVRSSKTPEVEQKDTIPSEKNNSQHTVSTISRFSSFDPESSTNIVYLSNTESSSDNTGKLYIWKTTGSVTIISMEPPPEGIEARIMLYSDNKKEVKKAANEITSVGNNKSDNNFSLADQPLKVYTPDGLREMIRYSEEIGEIIELRGEELNELVKLL